MCVYVATTRVPKVIESAFKRLQDLAADPVFFWCGRDLFTASLEVRPTSDVMGLNWHVVNQNNRVAIVFLNAASQVWTCAFNVTCCTC